MAKNQTMPSSMAASSIDRAGRKEEPEPVIGGDTKKPTRSINTLLGIMAILVFSAIAIEGPSLLDVPFTETWSIVERESVAMIWINLITFATYLVDRYLDCFITNTAYLTMVAFGGWPASWACARHFGFRKRSWKTLLVAGVFFTIWTARAWSMPAAIKIGDEPWKDLPTGFIHATTTAFVRSLTDSMVPNRELLRRFGRFLFCSSKTGQVQREPWGVPKTWPWTLPKNYGRRW